MAIYRVWSSGEWTRRAWSGQYIGGKNKVSSSDYMDRNKLTFRPKMKHRPFLQITLSSKPLGLEEGPQGRNVTCQYVMVRRKRSASKTSTTATPVVPTDSTNQETAQVKVGAVHPKTKGEKRKSEGSQGSGLDPTRGGKKRKK
jgi:hypothetical protein